ncbi:MAG: hypothetical protein QOJ29_497 [Thermoleophilaceae bacterium]|jgi:hypothetical protein|nr:hypothetical protein [Thermoleophilaceae bacterium]
MSSFYKRRPSPAMTVALIALFVALGGTGYAAMKLPRNSVGSAQLKSDAVRSSKVKNRSLLAKDFKAGQLPRGARGAPAAKYFASVASNGARRSGTASSVERTGPGRYNVRFAKDLSKCSAVVTPGWNRADGGGGGINGGDYAAFPGSAWLRSAPKEISASDDSVAVSFAIPGQDDVDNDFNIAVFC